MTSFNIIDRLKDILKMKDDLAHREIEKLISDLENIPTFVNINLFVSTAPTARPYPYGQPDITCEANGKFEGSGTSAIALDEEWAIGRNYRMGCDPYKEGGEGSFAIFQEPSVLTQEQFDAEVQRLAKFFNPKIDGDESC